ncbi:hypothetical protein D3C81_1545000 [compost metagenome]
MTPKPGQQITTYRRQWRVALQSFVVLQRLQQRPGGFRTLRLGHGHGTVEFDHRRGHHFTQPCIQRGDACPVGLFGAAGTCVAIGDGGLQHVGIITAVQLQCFLQGGLPSPDLQPIPAAAVLIQQQYRDTARTGACTQA